MTTKVKLAKQVTHSPRTEYNRAMWEAVTQCKGITTGVPVADLIKHCLAAVPEQQPSHALAHVKYLLRSKGALTTVSA